MKKLYILFILVFFGSLSLQAQVGKDFWLSFGNNNNDAINPSLRIRIVTTVATSVTITFTETGEVISDFLGANVVSNYNLNTLQRHAASSRSTGKSSKSIHIQTNKNVSVYAISMQPASTDATKILPTRDLGNSYYHLSCHTYYGASCSWPDGYTIVAIKNNTTIYENGVVKSLLDSGEVYSSYFCSDGTGKYITANNPVAYFVTNVLTDVPYYSYLSTADCLYEQLSPVSSWGKHFFVPVTLNGDETVKVIASQNNTTINLTGGRLVGGSLTLNTGQWAEIDIDIDSNGCYIDADKPVGVASFLKSLPKTNFAYYPYLSDPSLAWIPPIEQSINEATTSPFWKGSSNSTLGRHEALIVTPTLTQNLTEMSIDGGGYTALSGGSWHNHSSGYSYYTQPLNSVNSRISIRNPKGVMVFCYGVGTSPESYYYAANTATHKFDVNRINYQSFNGSITCNDSIEVEAMVNYPMDTAYGHLRWFINSTEQQAFKDSLHWKTQLPAGSYTILMIVKDQFGVADSLQTSFVIANKVNRTIYDTICKGRSILFGGKYYSQAGRYTDSLHTILGCDSIVSLDLSVNYPSDTTRIYDTICASNVPYRLNGFTVSTQGIFSRKISNINGCDSVITLYLSFHTEIDTTKIKAAICQNGTYNLNGFNVNQAGIYYRTASGINGCDSVILLDLTVTDVLSDTLTATICEGETYTDNGFNTNQAGIHQRITQAAGGCDSITVLNLSIKPVFDTIFTHSICAGEVYDFFGQNLSVSGVYTHNLTNQYGCDSMIILTLDIKPMATTQIAAFICKDTTFSFANKNLRFAGIYYDTLKTIQGCDSIIELTLDIDTLIYDFEISTMGFLCENKQIELTAAINNVDYLWNTGETSRSIRVWEEGLYSVAVNAGQCQKFKEIEVSCPCKMRLPNLFTPNGDGLNDVYLPEILFELESFSMVIFNRWGQKVYETNTYTAWNGKINGQDASAGVYFCVIEFSNKKYPTKKCVANSSVTLVR